MRAFASLVLLVTLCCEIQRWPILIPEGTPYDMLVVNRDRVIDRMSFTARRTLFRLFSNANSGAWS